MTRYKSAVLAFILAASPVAATAQVQPQNPDVLDEVRQILGNSFQARGGGGRGTSIAFPVAPINNTQANGAWWANTGIIQRLGITDDQKAKLDRAFENHRPNIVSSTAALEKEEAQLARLLAADPVDRNAVLSQTDRVIQARAELERTNSAMTLEMRGYLTQAQWMQLQPPQRVRVGGRVIDANLVSQVDPAYPEAARQAGIQGSVVLEVEISKEGIVEGDPKVVSGPQQLTQAAIDAVKQWRYRPTLLNGQAVAVITNITVNFPFTPGPQGAPAPATGQRRGGR